MATADWFSSEARSMLIGCFAVIALVGATMNSVVLATYAKYWNVRRVDSIHLIALIALGSGLLGE